ncbi:MAG: carbon-nitrogen family hydrolase [Leucobacter sp.]
MNSTSAPETSRIALVQVASPFDETQLERIARVEALLRQHSDVDLFVLPELWSAGYFAFDRYDELAETLDGPTVTMARGVARDLGASIHLGSIIERGENGALHNTAVLIDAEGRIAQTYRKIHVFGYRSLEAELLTPGTTLDVTATPFGELASTTCYDLRFPGLWQELSTRGAEVVVVPAAWPAARREHWELLTQARAVEHQLWVLACNACGVQGEGDSAVQLGGFSRVVDPSGRIVAECGDGEEVLVVDIDPARVAEVRAEFPVIADRLSAGDYGALARASSTPHPESGAGA